MWRLHDIVEFLFITRQAERPYFGRASVRKKRGEPLETIVSRIELVDILEVGEVALLAIAGDDDAIRQDTLELELGCPVPPSIDVVYAKRRSRPTALIEEIAVGEYCGVPAGNVRLINDRQFLHMFGLKRARVVSNDLT